MSLACEDEGSLVTDKLCDKAVEALTGSTSTSLPGMSINKYARLPTAAAC